jgi:HEAT repeat protein
MLSGPTHAQQEALHVIGQIKDKSFTKHILPLLEEKEILTKNHALISLAKLGDEHVVPQLMDLLLDHETTVFVLEHLLEFDTNILTLLQQHIHKLSLYDKAYLQHYCLRMKKAKKLLELLHLQHREYKHWRQRRAARIVT